MLFLTDIPPIFCELFHTPTIPEVISPPQPQISSHFKNSKKPTLYIKSCLISLSALSTSYWNIYVTLQLQEEPSPQVNQWHPLPLRSYIFISSCFAPTFNFFIHILSFIFYLKPVQTHSPVLIDFLTLNLVMAWGYAFNAFSCNMLATG